MYHSTLGVSVIKKSRSKSSQNQGDCIARTREFFVDNLQVRINFIIEMIRWTGLAPWEFEFPFPGSLASTFLVQLVDRFFNGHSCDKRNLENCKI